MRRVVSTVLFLMLVAVSSASVQAAQAVELKSLCEIGCDFAATACRVGCYEACALDPDPPACRARVASCRQDCEQGRDACYAECNEESAAGTAVGGNLPDVDPDYPVCILDSDSTAVG